MNKPLQTLFACLFPFLSFAAVASDTRLDLDVYKGKVVYVDFWASWCVPCRASFPFMQSLAHKYGDSLEIVAVNVDKNRSDAEQFLEQFDINFSVVYDSKGTLAESFDLKGMPTSYLYDQEGQLVGSHIGFTKKDIGKLESAIVNTINEQKIEK